MPYIGKAQENARVVVCAPSAAAIRSWAQTTHARTGRRYVIPSPGTVEAKLIYEALGLPMPDVPHALD